MNKLLEKILSLHHTAPFRVKIMGIVIFFVCLLGLTVILEMRTHMTGVLSDQLEQRGRAIANDVASRSVNIMLVGDTFSLYEIAKSISTHYDDVRYLMILDKNGQVVAHNFGQGVPVGLLELRDLSTSSNIDDILTVNSDEGIIHDIAAPIAEGKVGWVRLGMSENTMKLSIDYISKQLLFTTVFVTVLGLLVALLMSHLVTQPLRSLATASKGIAEGDLSLRVETQGEDEISQLGKNFNQMASSIESYSHEREALVKELKDKEITRQELLKKVISAQEDERKRISRELHDETSQSLTSLIIGLKVLSEATDTANTFVMARELRDLAATTLQEVHHLAVELRPTVLDDMGLIPAIERFVDSYKQKYNIDVDLHIQNKLQSRLSEEVETTLYRIVQEALTNIIKYADCRNVSILLDLKQEAVNLIVEDDGWGFDVEQVLLSGVKDKHLGIAGMKERATLLGGDFTIESAPGQGTTIFVRIPLERSKDINESD